METRITPCGSLCLALGQLLLLVSVKGVEVPEGCPTSIPQRHTSTIVKYQEVCYQYVDVEKFWDDARDYCWQNGGSLVTIDDPDTNRFIVDTLNSLPWTNNGLWIGLHDRSSELDWTWVTAFKNDARASWYNWGSGHPGAFLHSHRDCVRMKRRDGWKWHETYCHFLKYHYRFICEYDADELAEVDPMAAVHVGMRENPAVTTPSPTPSTEGHSETSVRSGGRVEAGIQPQLRSSSSHRKDTHHNTDGTEEGTQSEPVFEHGVKAEMRQSVEQAQSPFHFVTWICIAGVISILLLIIIFLLVHRRRSQNADRDKMVGLQAPAQDSISNPTYEKQHFTSCGTSSNMGQGSDQCGNMAEAPRAHAINYYVDVPHQLGMNPVSIHMNKGKQEEPMCGTGCDGYEVPKKNVYMDMTGSRELLQVDGGDCFSGELEQSTTENIYAEVPERMCTADENIYAEIPELRCNSGSIV